VAVIKATDAAEALKLAADVHIDAVLADYHLGSGTDGLELLQRLQATQKPDLAAALITADHGADVEVLARTAGYPLLYKPLRPAALRALLGAFRSRSYKVEAAGLQESSA
jgi:DNA-binding response OmpR family regulator